MVKRPKHPALARRGMKRRAQDVLDNVIESREWQFTPVDDKRFLLHYLATGDYKKAMEMTGVTHEWLAEREKDDNFNLFIDRAMALPTQVGVNMAKEAVPESISTMLQIMRHGRSENARLKAAEDIQKIAGVWVADDTTTVNNQFNFQMVHWNAGLAKSQPVLPDVVEGKVVEG